MERLKEDAEWEEDTQSWILPELTRIKLPPASGTYRRDFARTSAVEPVNIDGYDNILGASSTRQSVNSVTAPARLENFDNSLAIYTFHPLLQVNNA